MTLHRWTAELKTAGTVLLIGMLLLMTVSGTASAEGQPDYTDTDKRAYFGIGEDRAADVFLVFPTVDGKDEYNMSMTDGDTRASFLGALNMISTHPPARGGTF